MPESVDQPVFREECYRCFRARSVCICDRLPRINNRTGVIVLQHHREVLHPIGTARIARLGLSNVDVRVAQRSDQLQVTNQSIATPHHCPEILARTALVYPHAKAVSLEELDESQLPNHLILLDGTWSQASAMYRVNAWLHDLPHVVIRPDTQSNYRIRKQPANGCLSTIEALVYMLKHLEPATSGLDSLLQVFDSMVDQQLTHIDRRDTE